MIAANIDQCIGYTQPAVIHWAETVTENLYEKLALWEAAFARFSDDNVQERTVRNWKVPTAYHMGRVPNADSDQSQYAAEVITTVYAACNAAHLAESAGRITTAQLTQFVADWNTAWSF